MSKWRSKAVRASAVNAVTLLLASLASRAESNGTSDASEEHYAVRHWSTEEGLPQSSARALAQTPDGYLWIGTLDGLARFDGVRFTVFDKSNTPGIINDTINSLGVDAAGTLWIGTGDGLIEWRGGGVARRWSQADGLPTKEVYDVIPESGIGIWWRCREHICLLSNGSVSRYGAAHGITNETRSMHAHPAGGLLALTRFGAIHLPSNTRPAEAMIPWPTPSDFTQAQADEQGRVWRCDGQGFHRFEQGDWTLLTDWGVWDVSRGKHLFRDRAGGFWMSSGNDRLWRWHAGHFARVPLPEGALGRGVAAMLEDGEGNIWIGTGGNGLLQLRPLPIRTFTVADRLPDDETWSVSVGPDGSVWAATKGGLARIQENQVKTVPGDPRPDYAGSPVFADSAGAVWLAKQQAGLYRFANGGFEAIPTNQVWNGFIGTFYEDRDHRVWLECNREVLVRTAGGRFERAFTNNFGANVRGILEDRQGNFWFATRGKGVVRWNPGTVAAARSAAENFSRFTTANGLAGNNVWALHQDAEGVIWIGGDAGLTRFKDARFFAYTAAQGLAENRVNHIEEDASGHLWLSGLRGLHRIARGDLEEVARGKVDRVRCVNFGEADGMASAETNKRGQPAGCKTPDGRLWFPTGQGVAVIDPAKIPEQMPALPVLIEEVKMDEQDVRIQAPAAELRGYKLGPEGGRLLEIRYTANSFAAPDKVQFRYKLEPRDPSWHPVGTQRFVFLRGLRPGNYTFRVSACNHHGVWNEAGATFAFSLAPRFYETWPFYVACAVGMIAVAAGLTGYRLRWQHRLLSEQHAHALAEERARIARDLHDDFGTALTGVALELDLARRQAGDGVANRLGETAHNIRTLAERMREVVWAVNPNCDTVSSLASFLEQQAGLLLKHTPVRARFEFPEELPALSVDSETRHQLALGVREAITNVLRHAQASELVVSLSINEGEMSISVRDNGCGFDATIAPTHGNGLRNLRTRLERLGGHCEIHSTPGTGTRVEFWVPLAYRGEGKESK